MCDNNYAWAQPTCRVAGFCDGDFYRGEVAEFRLIPWPPNTNMARSGVLPDVQLAVWVDATTTKPRRLVMVQLSRDPNFSYDPDNSCMPEKDYDDLMRAVAMAGFASE